MNIAFFLRMLLPEILFLLQLTVKNPAAVATELPILIAVRDALNVLIKSIEPNP